MKKIIALVLSVMMMCTALCAMAENTEPMFATVGDALAAAGEFPIAGGEDDYFAIVTEKDGQYWVTINLQTEVIEDIVYDSGLAGNG